MTIRPLENSSLPASPAHRGTTQAINVHGSAHWMTSTEAKAAGFNASTGVVLGRKSDGELLRFAGDGHIMVFAPTGAGKGIGFVQPNLAEYPGSMVVLDPKGENSIRSAAQRRKLGQRVIVLDPFGKTGMVSDTYNPLGALTHASKESIGPMIEAIADALIPNTEHTREPHWPLGAKRFISFLLWFMTAHLPEDERNLVKLFELVYSGRENLERIAAAMEAGSHPDPDIRRVCVGLGNWFFGREEKEFSYFESQAQNNLGWVGDFVWATQLAAKPSPPLPLKDEKITVYLVLPFHRLDRYRPWLRLMVADMLNALYDAPGEVKDEPVLFMLDEAFSGLGNMDILFAAAAAVRSAGARICFIYQDIAQVEKLYGKSWVSLIANSGATLFWSVNDPTAARLISDTCGSKTVPVPGQPVGMAQPLIRPEQVMQLPADEIVGLFRNLPPARFGRLNVLTDKRFKPRLNFTPVPEEKSTTYKPVSTNWVPVDLSRFSSQPAAKCEPAGYFKDRQTEELSKEFGRTVVKDAAGNFGYLDAQGIFVPLSS